jgi:hypothetical protein
MAVSNGPATGSYVNSVGLGDVLDVTLSADTSAMADNDVIAAPQEVTGFFRLPGGRGFVQTIRLLDEDLQTQDIDILFLDATGSIGAENAAFAPTDAVARTILGSVSFVAADYITSSNNSMATKSNLGLMLKCASGTTSVWVAAICRSGTPTYTASGLKLKVGVMWD